MQEKRTLAFIIPGVFNIEPYQKALYYNDIPLGVLQISSFLKQQLSLNVQLIDLRYEDEINVDLDFTMHDSPYFTRILQKILNSSDIHEAEAIAISCYTSFQYQQAKLIAGTLREIFPHKLLIVGGYHPTALPNDFRYQDSPFNYIIRGEAEQLLLDIIEKQKLNKIPKNSPQIISNSVHIDINQLPLPDYSLFLEKYGHLKHFRYDFYASRGCPYQCAFCGKNYYFRSFYYDQFADQFEKLIEIIRKYNQNGEKAKIGFADQSFNRVDIRDKILEYIQEQEYHEEFDFSCQSRVETLQNDLKTIKLLRKLNFIVGFGFESADPSLLLEMDKTENPEKYVSGMTYILNEYKTQEGPYCRLNILCGFPGEDLEKFTSTITYIKNYALHQNIQLSPSLFLPYPNTHVFRNMEHFEINYGTLFIKNWWQLQANPFKMAVPEKISDSFSKKDLIYSYKETYAPLLRVSKINSFADLILWKEYYNKWYRELSD